MWSIVSTAGPRVKREATQPSFVLKEDLMSVKAQQVQGVVKVEDRLVHCLFPKCSLAFIHATPK